MQIKGNLSSDNTYTRTYIIPVSLSSLKILSLIKARTDRTGKVHSRYRLSFFFSGIIIYAAIYETVGHISSVAENCGAEFWFKVVCCSWLRLISCSNGAASLLHPLRRDASASLRNSHRNNPNVLGHFSQFSLEVLLIDKCWGDGTERWILGLGERKRISGDRPLT